MAENVHDEPREPCLPDLTTYSRTIQSLLEAWQAFGVAIRAAVEQISPLIAAMYAAYDAVEPQPQPRRRRRNHPQRRHNRSRRRK